MTPDFNLLRPERMTAAAREQLYEAINTGRLIAFVGSGTSLVYGQPTWTEFVKRMVEELRVAASDASIAARSRIGRTRDDGFNRAPDRILAQIETLHADRYDDAVMILELVRRAFETLDRVRSSHRDSKYQMAIQTIFIDRAGHARNQFAQRMQWAMDSTAQPPSSVFDLETLSNRKTLNKLCIAMKDGVAEIEQLGIAIEDEAKRVEEDFGQLPTDRRSLIAPILAIRRAIATMRGCEPVLIEPSDTLERQAPLRPLLDPLRELDEWLDIRRFMTTNYDLELEKLLMFDRQGSRMLSSAANLSDVTSALKTMRLQSALDGAVLTVTHPDGVTVRSDSRDGRHLAPYIEFALGSVDTGIHILHHHGRIDLPEHIIAADAEYNQMYRAAVGFTEGQERAYDLLFEGNPVLFVGSGMTEAELNRTLRMRVSNPDTPSAPVFVLREAVGTPQTLMSEQEGLAVKLGVHVLHFGHPRRGAAYDLRKHLRLLDALAGLFKLQRHQRRPGSGDLEWIKQVADATEEISLSPFTDFATAKAIMQDKFALFWSLDFDRVMLAFLCADVARDKKLVATLGDDPNARALLGDYLGRLAIKVRSAALRHELRQLGYESRLFHEQKSKTIQGRETGGRGRHIVRHVSLSARPKTIEWRGRLVDARDKTKSVNIDDVPGVVTDALAQPTGAAVIILGERGTGKGTLLEAIARAVFEQDQTRCLVVNCSYGQEADSIVSLVTDFLCDGEKNEHRLTRRERLLASRCLLQPSSTPIIVLGAVDRLFGTDDHPLAAEFEWLLAELLHPERKVRVVITGSMRAKSFLVKLATDLAKHLASDVTPQGTPCEPVRMLFLEPQSPPPAINGFLRGLIDQSDDHFASRKDSARKVDACRRRAITGSHRLVDDILGNAFDRLQREGPIHSEDSQRARGRLAMEIVRALAFMGLPIEASVLPSVPRIAALQPTQSEIDAAVRQLLEEGLAIAIEPYAPHGGSPPRSGLDVEMLAAEVNGGQARLVLHRLITQVLRERHGIPNNETVLSDSYNITLYAAQPDDAATPDTSVTNELEKLADHLMHAYRDGNDRASSRRAEDLLLTLKQKQQGPIVYDLLAKLKRADDLSRIRGDAFAAGARAAGGVIRGYLSAVNLFSFDVDDPRSRTGEQSVVGAQKKRIRRLLDNVIDSQSDAADDLGVLDTMAVVPDPAMTTPGPQPLSHTQTSLEPDEFTEWALAPEIKSALQDAIGSPVAKASTIRPFYDAEIVWLLNERAMLSLAQGDLYAASTTFRLAFDANRPIEGNRYHPNNCRLLLNRSMLWIERGRIADARRCLEQLKRGLGAEPDALSPATREGKLVLALATGYIALCDQLNGLAAPAQAGYRAALTQLGKLQEQRAIAIFEYHLGTLLQASRAPQDIAAPCFARAIEAAEGGRHVDVLYRIRIAKAVNDRRHGSIDDREVMLILSAAVDYGRKLEMHRASVEALSARALLRLHLGDSEAAGVDCKDALAIATRNGMTLRRISLRIVAGQIYERRRDLPNAKLMFRAAISEATHYGFSRASELAGTQLMLLGHL